jgi:hypothetical protein
VRWGLPPSVGQSADHAAVALNARRRKGVEKFRIVFDLEIARPPAS